MYPLHRVPRIAFLDKDEDVEEEDQLDPDQYIYNPYVSIRIAIRRNIHLRCREEYGLAVKPEPKEDQAWSTAGSEDDSNMDSVPEHETDAGVYPVVASAPETTTVYTNKPTVSSATSAADHATAEAGDGNADAESETDVEGDIDAEGDIDNDEERADAQETAEDAWDALDNASHTADFGSDLENVAAANDDNDELELIDDAWYDASDSSSNEAAFGSDTPDLASDTSDTSTVEDDIDAAPTPDPLTRCIACGHIHLPGPQFYQNCTAFMGPQADATGMTAYHPYAYIHGDAALKVPVANIANATGVAIAVRASLARCRAEERAFQERRPEAERRREEEEKRWPQKGAWARYEEMLRVCGYPPSAAVQSLSGVTRGYGCAVQVPAHTVVSRVDSVQPYAPSSVVVPSLSLVTRGYRGAAQVSNPVPIVRKRRREAGDESGEEEGRTTKALRR